MGLSGFVAMRYLRSQRSRFVSFITVIAVVSITIGVMVLDTTLAVMNGFRDQIQFKFVENMPMVTVLTNRPGGFGDLDALVERVEAVEGVEGASPFIREHALVSNQRFGTRSYQRPGVVWGIDPARQGRVTSFEESIEPAFTGFGSAGMLGIPEGTPGLVLGVNMAAGIRAGIGDLVALTVARGSGGLDELEAHTVDFAVVGILESGMYEFDNTFMYMDLAVAQELFLRPDNADGIGVSVSAMLEAPAFAEAIEKELGSPPYFCNDWINLNSQLFEWIRIEKTMMFLLLSLITLVASFSVVAILMMMVRDRQRDIGVFLSMGTPKAQLMAIFVQLGMILGLLGVLLGSLLGFGLCVLLDTVGFPLPGEVYFVDTLPVHTKWSDFTIVAAVTLAMSLLATLLPSWLATRFTPVEVLRYE